MIRLLVTYASDYGHTRSAAHAVAEGASGDARVDVQVESVGKIGSEEVAKADAIIVGSPVHMGTPHWEAKRFIDESLGPLWIQDRMVGKVGAVFSTGGGLGGAGGGCELTMVSLLSAMAELGMVLVPLPKTIPAYAEGGLHWGPYVRCADDAGRPIDLPPRSIPMLKAHGANIARVALRLSSPVAVAPGDTREHPFKGV